MSGTTLVRTAIFAAGALVGGGVATLLSNGKQASRPSPVASTVPPLVKIDKAGKTSIVAPLSAASAVLKYGNPGEYSFSYIRITCFDVRRTNRGPVGASSLCCCL